MGFYVNPGNANFKEIVKDDYVDKTGLISVVNSTIGTRGRLSCVSRPRRFGKSYAAKMLAAYYDCSCDSHMLFDGLAVSLDPSYEEHINKYHVLYLDITGFMSDTSLAGLTSYIKERVIKDLHKTFPAIPSEDSMKEYLASIVDETGRQFVAIIDEWDAPIRDPDSTPETQKNFLEFLRSLFKSDITQRVFAAAYMTGILPIKKDGTQSAISEFWEYTIIRPKRFAPYEGFLEEEVREVCEKNHVSFEKMRDWYNGYHLVTVDGDMIPVYNPNSVMRASIDGDFQSYWSQSSAVNGAADYINLNFDGLGEAAERLTAGLEVSYDTQEFQNDLTSFQSADDVLTLLTYFGYLTYDMERGVGWLPNYEVRTEFGRMIHRVTHDGTVRRLKESEQLLQDIIAGNEDAVAASIQNVHMRESAPLWYNNEQALRAVVKLAFFTYRDHYVKLEELPGGTGYADLAYIPKKLDPSPVMIIELKAGGTPEEAIAQMRSRNYQTSLDGFGTDVLLVSITYEKGDKTKPHHCRIERISFTEDVSAGKTN